MHKLLDKCAQIIVHLPHEFVHSCVASVNWRTKRMSKIQKFCHQNNKKMKFYKINPKVLSFVKKHKACREELCRTMNVDNRALDYHLNNNIPNGTLTKYFALEVIAKYYNAQIHELIIVAKLTKEVA